MTVGVRAALSATGFKGIMNDDPTEATDSGAVLGKGY